MSANKRHGAVKETELKLRKSTFALFLAALLSAAAVGCADGKTIDGVRYEPVGVVDLVDKAPGIQYEVSWGNVVWSVIFCETIVVPIILVGWYLWEPAGKAPGNLYRPPSAPPAVPPASSFE